MWNWCSFRGFIIFVNRGEKKKERERRWKVCMGCIFLSFSQSLSARDSNPHLQHARQARYKLGDMACTGKPSLSYNTWSPMTLIFEFVCREATRTKQTMSPAFLILLFTTIPAGIFFACPYPGLNLWAEGNILPPFIKDENGIADWSVSRAIHQGSKEPRKRGRFWTLWDWEHSQFVNTNGDIGDPSHMKLAITLKLTWHFPKKGFIFFFCFDFFIEKFSKAESCI